MKKILFALSIVGGVYVSNAQFNTTVSGDLETNKQVGIGTTTPNARLDVLLGSTFLNTDQSGVRITYPALGSINPVLNESIFEVRSKNVVGSGYNTRFTVDRLGKIGVGTLNPNSRLDLRMGNKEEVILQSTTANTYTGFSFRHSDGTENWKIRSFSNYPGGYGNILGVINPGNDAEFWVAAKKMLVGNYFDFDSCTDCEDYMLFVRKGIRTERVKVDVAGGVWADYVFDENYKLKSLYEVESYINENHHLPGVPSAKKMETEGLDVAKTDALLLEKIEELTLYIIKLQKEVDALKVELSESGQ